MGRKLEIKKLEKRLELLKSEEILVDRILEDTVEVIKVNKQGNFDSNTNIGLNNKVQYRLQVIRKGTTIICKITDKKGLVLFGEGVARCHEGDEFDSKIGFAIAQFRAKADWSSKSVDRFMDRMGIN